AGFTLAVRRPVGLFCGSRSGVGATTPFFVPSGVSGLGCERRSSAAGLGPGGRGRLRARRRGVARARRQAHRARSPRPTRRGECRRLCAIQQAAFGLPGHEPDHSRPVRVGGQLAGDRSSLADAREPRAVCRQAGGPGERRAAGRQAELRRRAARASGRTSGNPHGRRRGALVRMERREDGAAGRGSMGGPPRGRGSMNYEILDALSQITREKSVDRALLAGTLETGVASAVRKKHGATADVEVRFQNDTGSIAVALRKTVVETVEDPALQLTVEEARAHKAGAKIGDVLTFPLPIAEFGRNAIQTAKQVLIQRVREAERERVFKEYADKVGILVRGVVQQVDRGNVIVKLDRSEGFLPAREQIPRSYHRQGDYVRAVVINVDRSAKGPQVILSRTHPDFLRRLFESEVPEIAENIVEIKAVAREAGARSKISVFSTDPRVDAVGSCVRVKGSRGQSIVRGLGGERIDIVPWPADPAVFVSRALAPARVADVRVNEAEKRMLVVVADDQLSLAIGKGGQNARLAARLTGWKIDLVSKSDEKKRQ